MTKPDTLEALFVELESAVRDKDRQRALELADAIQQRIAVLADEVRAHETRVQTLIAQLNDAAETNPAAFEIELPRPPRRRGGLMGYAGPSDLKPLQPDVVASGVEAVEQAKGVDYPVWFATNRKPSGDGGFTGERHDVITRGRVTVHVPRSHQFGETGSSFFKRLWRGDDRMRVKDILNQAEDVFYADVCSQVMRAREAGDAPQALLFLHGYNNSFDDAAIRAAQIGYDLKIPGPTAFFSWPSLNDAKQYPADEAAIEGSEGAIANFLIEFAKNCGTQAIHVIAHSMGNRGLLRALQRIAANVATRGQVRFHQIILAAPDVDRDLFLGLAQLYADHSLRTTLYASDADLAIYLSTRFHNAPRAGYYTPYTVTAGVDTVTVPNFDVDLLGHSYFAKAEALLHDIFDLLRYNEPPAKRQRIAAASDQGASFWTIKS